MTIPLTVRDAGLALRSGEITSVGLVEEFLARADRLDSRIGTYMDRYDDLALAAAARADAELAAGHDRGPLHGVPIGIKDLFATVDGPTTAQSLVLDRAWGAGREGPAVRRLKDAGAVVMGKTTTMEFGLALPDFSKPFPIPRNPWDLGRWPGGSSSGTGNGIAAGLFLAGIGTDTGGSIRLPSAFCGVTGLKPTYGLVPKSDVVPGGWTQDHAGPLARSAWDCAAMMDILAGYDESDGSTVDQPVPAYLEGIENGISGLRIGVLREGHFGEESDPAARPVFERAMDVLAGLGAELVEVSVPYFQEVSAASLLTTIAEAVAYHAPDLRSRPQDFFQPSRDLLYLGLLVSSADYVQAQRVRRVGQRTLAEVFAEVDVIVNPPATIGAPKYEDLQGEGNSKILSAIHTLYWDAVGNPVLAVPTGFTADRVPLSMQLSGRPFEDATVLRVGHAFQSATAWHLQVPDIARRDPHD